MLVSNKKTLIVYIFDTFDRQYTSYTHDNQATTINGIILD